MRARSALGVVLSAALVAGCSGDGNTGRHPPPQELVAQVPWTNGAKPLVDENGKAILPEFPAYPPIGEGLTDPGSRAPDCGALDDIELSGWRHDFEPTMAGYVGIAQFWSVYDDGSDGSFHTPGDAAWYPGLSNLRDGTIWGLPADHLPADDVRHFSGCAQAPDLDDVPDEWALHVRGGRFNWYGGGAEHPLTLDCGTAAHQLGDIADLCTGDAIQNYTFDVSDYDGIAFWARQGPDGAGNLMVGLQNKYTSDFLARTDPTMGGNSQEFCKRIYTCFNECENGAECRPFQAADEAQPVLRCADPEANPLTTIEPSLLQLLFPPCGADACEAPWYFKDPDFEGSQCQPYAFTGKETKNFCYHDSEAESVVTPPPRPSERCGDGFVAALSLTTDWKLYKIPFTEFRQSGFAKEAPFFDLKSIYSVAFQYSVGNTDFYVDNLSFYRYKR